MSNMIRQKSLFWLICHKDYYMRLRIFIISIFVFSLFQPQIIEAQKKRPVVKKTTNNNLTSRQIADKVLPSVVLIITQDENEKPISQGSGFIIGKGLVVSNLHVFERATDAVVKNVKTGEISKAIEVVGMNAKEDICVFRIDNTKFPILSLGNSESVQTGDEIYVASNPKGLEGSFTKGIISSLRNDVGLFQIDAAISSGSSGGVLVNQKAEAVGIIKSSLVSGQNLNFAIPINKLKAISYKFKHAIQLAGSCAYTDRAKNKLKGKVKSVIEKSRFTEVKNGKLFESDPVINSISKYDFDGNMTEYQVNSVEGVFAWKYIYQYDENRLRTSIITQENNGASKTSHLNLSESIDTKLYWRKFSGNIGSISNQGGMQVFDGDGNLTIWYINNAKIIFAYDSEGEIRESTQLQNGEVRLKKRYRYKNDEFGNWIEQYEFNNFPNPNVDSSEWFEGETKYREITYYE